MDASNMLKPALARGELHVIGATTLDEYRKNVEKDPALERRFQPVFVREPTVDETIEILQRPARPLRGVSPRPHHRRGDHRGRGAVRPLHPRPLPPGQGDRPDRPGERARPPAHEDEGQRDEVVRGRPAPARARARPGDLGRGLRPGARREGADRHAPGRARRPQEGSAAAVGGDGRGHRRGRVARDRHPGFAVDERGARAAAPARAAAARADRRPGRGGRGRRGSGPPLTRRARRPEPTRRELPVPRADGRRQDGARPCARGVPLRERGPDGPLRHERVPGAAYRVAAGRRAAGLRRLRGGGPAQRTGAKASVLGAPLRRDREGAPGHLQHPAPDPRRRTPDRRAGPHRRLQAHGRDHDLEHRRRSNPGAGAHAASRSSSSRKT